jgi:uncharacterized protein (UPF0276 family)
MYPRFLLAHGMDIEKTYFPNLGFGLGLRPPHYAHILEHTPPVDWFEIISENFMDTDGKPRRNLTRIREHYPIVMHGVALSIGTVDPLNSEYLYKLKKLADEINPAWISDHLCWTGIAHKNTHDLLPVPYTEEALKHIISRIKTVQDYLERPIALENPSTYLEFTASHIPEAEFIAEMANQSGCYLLLDVNNVYVSCYNHRLNPRTYINTLPLNKVIQIHLSGHCNMGTHIIDTHDDHVIDAVWDLYKYTLHKIGHVPNTMIEWDDNIPEWHVLYAELEKAKVASRTAANYAQVSDFSDNRIPHTILTKERLGDAQATMQQAILSDVERSPDSWIRGKEQFTADAQLAVYINAYRSRLYYITAEDYPALRHCLGEEVFSEVITAFVASNISEHFNVARYASALPDFIRKHCVCSPLAYELATMETALVQIFDAPETEVLEAAHLAETTEESIMQSRLYPRKALQLFTFTYPINRYYLEVIEGNAPPSPAPEKTYLAVFRHDDVVWRMDLEEAEYLLLQTLFSGKTIGEALGNLRQDYDAGTQISDWFSRWIRNGLLTCSEYRDESIGRNVA